MITIVENLPNVCIRNIVLDSVKESDVEYKITVDVVVKGDDISSLKWYEDEFLLKHLSLVIVKSSNESFNQDVSSGAIMINGANINSYSDEEGDIVVKQVSLAQKTKILQQEDSCIITVEFHQKTQGDNVDIYAMTQINMVDISNSYGVDLKIPNMNMYCGPVVSESIFKNGLIVTQSNLLMTTGGQVYYGPVHNHPDSGYMVGSKHSQEAHPSLVVQSVPNIKLKDNRFKSYVTSNTAVQDYKNNSIFSPLEVSHNRSETMNGIFSINVNTLMLNKSKYGKLLSNLSPKVYEPVLENFKIKHFKLYKRKVKQYRQNKKINKYLSKELLIDSKDRADSSSLINRLKIQSVQSYGHNDITHVETDYFDQNTFVNSNGETEDMFDYKKLSSIREEALDIISSDFQGYTRTFSFVDGQTKSRFNDKYAYEVDISFYDPSITAVQDIVTEIEQSISNLNRYINLSLKHKNYDFKAKKLKEQYISSLSSLFADGELPWIQPVVVYVKYYTMLKKLSELDQESIMENYYNFLSPPSFDVNSAKSFLYKFKEFSTAFMKYFKVSNTKLQNLTSGNSQRIYQNVNFTDIEINHKFSNVLDFKNVKTGFEYLIGPETPNTVYRQGIENLLTFSKEAFTARIQLEMQRFPASSTNPQTSVSFLSPMSFHHNDKIYELNTNSNLNYRKMFNSTADVETDSTSPSPSTVIQTIQYPHAVSADLPSMLSDGDTGDIDYIKASKYIGSRYGIVQSDEEGIIPESSYNQSSTEMQQLIMDTGFTMLEENMNVPMPWGTPPSVQESYFQDLEGQTLSTPANKSLFAVLFFSLQKIEYKKKLSSTTASLKKDNWSLLTLDDFNSLEGDILFRLVPHSSDLYPAGHANTLRAYNRLFVVRFPKNTPTLGPNVSTPSMAESLTSRAPIENTDYIVSNIVSQPTMRDGINSGFVYSSMPTEPYTTESTVMTTDTETVSTPSAPQPQASAPSPMSTSGGGSYGY